MAQQLGRYDDQALPAPALGRGEAPVLTTRGLTKRFPGVVAVDAVDLDIAAGEIVALLGQNGAGKSTLIQALAGLHPYGSYDGEVTVGGQPLRATSVTEAEAAGIVLIPQEVAVVPDMTVAANMFLGAEPKRRGLVDWAAVHAQAQAVLRQFNVDVPVDARMGSLDLATQQLIVIARALSKRARVLILDEPTAALTEHEAQRLFGHLRTLRANGVSSIFVTHRLAEVFALADRVVVLRDGRLRGDHLIGATSHEAVVTEMIGHPDVEQPAVPAVQPAAESRVPVPERAAEARALEVPALEVPALEVEDLHVHDPEDPDRLRVAGLSFTLHRGEILGLFGLVGAGCGAAAYAIFGAWEGRVTGTIRRDGREVTIRRTSDGIAAGIGLLAQDRRAALVLDHSIADNIALASLPALGRRGWLDLDAKALMARRFVEALQIKAPSVDARVGTLSGGNQQKVQVARWLAAEAKVLLLVDPTRGVDVGARAEIYALLHRLAADGYAVLLVSSEAEELVATCTRALVMRHGRLAAEQRGARITEAALLHAAAGT